MITSLRITTTQVRARGQSNIHSKTFSPSIHSQASTIPPAEVGAFLLPVPVDWAFAVRMSTKKKEANERANDDALRRSMKKECSSPICCGTVPHQHHAGSRSHIVMNVFLAPSRSIYCRAAARGTIMPFLRFSRCAMVSLLPRFCCYIALYMLQYSNNHATTRGLMVRDRYGC